MSNKQDSIELKLAKATALLSEVPVLMQHGFYATVINRLYYACFHATKALLLSKDIIPKTHSGVIGMLHKNFVQEGLFEYEHAAFFSRLMQERIEDDYNDFLIPDEDEVKEFVDPAKKYIAYIYQMLKTPQK